MGSKTISLIEFAKAFKGNHGQKCVTCASPYAKVINDAGQSSEVALRPMHVLAWLKLKDIDLSPSSVTRHIREKHWEREAKKAGRA